MKIYHRNLTKFCNLLKKLIFIQIYGKSLNNWTEDHYKMLKAKLFKNKNFWSHANFLAQIK